MPGMPTEAPAKRVQMPKTNPGGMEGFVVPARVPRVPDRVQIGPIGIPMDEFCALVEAALTTTPIRPDGDPRARLIERITNHGTILRPDGAVLINLDPPAHAEVR